MSLARINKRKIIINVTVVLAVTLFAFYYLTKSDVIALESVKGVRWWNYLLVIACVFFGFAILSLVDLIIYRSFTKSMNFGKCFVNTLSGNLGSGVTPLKSGHFPLMAYYQHNAGVPINDTVTGLVKCQILYSATSIVLYSVVVTALAIGGYTLVFYGQTVKLWLVVSLGLIFHVAVFTVIVILSYNATIQNKILKLWAKFLLKIKKIENVEEYLAEKSVKFQTYREQLSIIGKNFVKYLLPSFLYAFNLFLTGSIPYISYLLITGSTFSFSALCTFYTLNLASAYITNIIPVPGGVGTSEVLFSLVFASVVSDSYLGSVLILTRVASFYLTIVINLLVFACFLFVKRKQK
ncbi:MAG: flippase-like domain-containing protein [Clostridia bacterium]|nr:flippase-like domain-containing protein [Clostridia bacterium]